jgi:hypothetical protein
MGKYINSLLLLLFMGVCFAIPPGPISYQAVLKDAFSEPIVGTHLINFYLYDVDTGGSYLWMEGHNIDIDSSGVYNALLGSATRFPDSVDFSMDYWLGITVDRGEELVPRYKLTASPYAYYARDISSMGAADGQLIKWCDSLSKWIPSKDDTGRVSWDTLSAYYDTTSLQFPGGSRVSWWNLINIPWRFYHYYSETSYRCNPWLRHRQISSNMGRYRYSWDKHYFPDRLWKYWNWNRITRCKNSFKRHIVF